MSHIPETERTKWAKKIREDENRSLDNIFLRTNEIAEKTEDEEVI